ncbi:hypothetical protein JCM14036_25130 [Desulfotomaculum defluvii]
MLTLINIAVAFGGGMFGTAVGALAAFIFAGFFVIAGLNDLAFGPFIGPHVAFSGAVCASAFAAKRGLESGKDIITPLIKLNDGAVLLVGGIFGALGYIIASFLNNINTPTDTVALTVVIQQVAAALIFGNKKIISSYKLPDSKTAFTLILLGLGAGLISAYAAVVFKNTVIGFGLAAVSLILVQFMGTGPVTHHIVLPAAVAAAAVGNIWIGGLFGILGALLGDFFGKTLNEGTTHIDPPAATIALLTAVAVLLL